MQQARTAAAYIRVSTEDQAEYSPDAQLVEIRKYAARSGYVIPDAFVFQDEGISGKRTEKRDAFNRMIGLAKQKPRPFAAILLWKFSRFARNREDSVVYKSMLRKQLGIEVISISEPVGDDKMSILIEALIEAMDEYYSINLAEEVKRGMTEKARRGGLQAAPPFGYCVRDHCLWPVPEEAALVREIFKRYLAGDGPYEIARDLNALGIRTRRGGCFESRSVDYILCNPVYIGKLRWNPGGRTGRNFEDAQIITAASEHEAILDEKTWQAVQARRAEQRAARVNKKRPASAESHLLSGLLRCAACQRTLVFTKPHYWKCNGYAKGVCAISQHTRDENIQRALMDALADDLYSETDIQFSLTPLADKRQKDSKDFPSRCAAIERQLARLQEAYLAGVEQLDAYASKKATLEEQSLALRRAWEEERKADADATLPEPPVQLNLHAILQGHGISVSQKRKALQEIIDAVYYDKAGACLSICYHVLRDES